VAQQAAAVAVMKGQVAAEKARMDALQTQQTRLQAILANSFIHAVMAMEAGLSRSQPAPARPEFATFANNVDSTLYFLAAYLRGVPARPGDLPDLREAHHALVHAGVPDVERYELVNVESDRVTNSLNTLAGEVIQWAAGG
jgi:hypothetical protein